MKIEMIAFDADDTLWHGEVHYLDALVELIEILAPWGSPDQIDTALAEIEMKNLPIYGYGVKAFVLSMIEGALQISKGQIPTHAIEKILSIGRAMLETEIVLLPHVTDTLEELSRDYPLMVITKGDLLDQTSKVSRSGLEKFFPLVEVVNDKTPESYRLILDKFQINPKNLVMVGNSIRSDVLPVLTLGGKAVYIPANTTWEHEMVPDFDPAQEGFYEIVHMGLLPKLVAKILDH